MAYYDHVVSDCRHVWLDRSICNPSAGFEHRTNHCEIQLRVEPYLILRSQAFAITRQQGYALWDQPVGPNPSPWAAPIADNDVAVCYQGSVL